MDNEVYDITVIGSGLGGAVCATVLAKQGFNVLMIEKGSHPRFALGESATPVTTFYFKKFSEMYDIPEYLPLSSYHTMDQAGKKMIYGPKELFHYCWHDISGKKEWDKKEIAVQTPGVDVQYYREDLDFYLVEIAEKYGVEYIDNANVTNVEEKIDYIELTVDISGEVKNIHSKYVIDATGFKSVLADQFDLRMKDPGTPLKSRTIFTHFKNINSLESVVSNGDNFNDDLPVHRSQGTTHHCFDGGWYWIIPFDNGVTSVGLSLDMHKYPDNDLSAEDEFWEITNKLPTVKNILTGAKTVRPYIKTGRIQYQSKKSIGDRWALLPAASYGIDAWQSSGMALTLISIDRLVWGLKNIVFRFDHFQQEEMSYYNDVLKKEYENITGFVYGIYKSFKHHDLLRHFCLLPFMGVEKHVLDGGLNRPWDNNSIFMNFGNPHFSACVKELHCIVDKYSESAVLPKTAIDKIKKIMLEDMAIYNTRDYGDEIKSNIYLRQEKETEMLESVMQSNIVTG